MQTYYSRKQLEALFEPIGHQHPTRLDTRLGGGGKATTVQAPDYTGAAQATAASSAATTAAQTAANRPNIITPFGTQSWSNTPTFDQAGFDAANANYAKTATAAQPGTAGGYQTQYSGDGNTSEQWVPGTAATAAGNSAGAAPTRAQYTGADNWTQTTTLTPAQQQALDSQQAMGQARSDTAASLMPAATAAATKPIDYGSMQAFGTSPTLSNFQTLGAAPTLQGQVNTSGVSAMPGTDNSAYVQEYVDQANKYMDPTNQAAQSALDTQLSNKGVMQGSDAYDMAQMNLHDQQSRNAFNAVSVGNQQANTMYTNNLAANNQSFNQALSSGQFANTSAQNQNAMNTNNAGFNNTTMQNAFGQENTLANYNNTLRQQQIAEAQMQQLQPLNVMNALTSGQQVSMPNMPSFNTAQSSAPVNYSQAAQAQYQTAQDQANAQNASSSNLTSGLMGLAGKGLMAYGTGGMSLLGG